MSTLAINARQLILLMMLTVMPFAAHSREYLIEVVLFENLSGRTSTAGGLYLPKLQNSLRLGSDEAINQGFILVEENLSLENDAADIANSGQYRLIRHLAWRQPGLDEDTAIPIRIQMGSSISGYLPEDINDFDHFIPMSLEPSSEFNRDAASRTLNGSIKVRLGRFLHMEVLLVFTDTDSRQSFRLLQSRKMRSRELHYIDNPRFGLLTRIVPIEE